MKNNTNTQRQLAMKSLVLAMAGAGLLSLPQHVLANPTGGQVVAGNVTIRQESATKVGITQTTDKGIIDWQKFSIGANEHVQFYQPSASSVTLNRVVGQDPSQILGRLTANGQIFLVNPNGIFFGKNAQIDVAGLVASTHNIRNEDFLAGRYNFNIPGKPGAAVINEGSIRIADTGIAAFVAPSVANRGVIVARLGKVALAAANGFTLDFHGDQLLSFLVSDDVAKTAFDLEGQQLTSFVENSGRIEAQGGYVLLTAKAAENAIHGVINHSGVIEATTVGTQKGEIILHAGKGSLEVSGTLDASAPNGGDGGFVETSGAQLSFLPSQQITTLAASGNHGIWLIDPLDILVGTGGVSAAVLNSAQTNVILEATNNITFQAAVNIARAGVGITAKAGRNIQVDANITTNNGEINLLAGFDNFTGTPGVNDGKVIINGARVNSGTAPRNIIGRAPSTDGLVGYWTLDGSAKDGSGNANNGTASANVTFVSDGTRQAAKFGGISRPGSIAVANSSSLTFTPSMSLSYWVRMDSTTGMNGFGGSASVGTLGTAVAKSHDRSGFYTGMSTDSSGKYWAGFGNNAYSSPRTGIGAYVGGNTADAIGQWTHIAYTFSANESKLYINGTLASTVVGPVSFAAANSQNLYFGKFSDSWYPLNGALDEVRLYNRTLNSTQVAELYRGIPQLVTPPVTPVTPSPVAPAPTSPVKSNPVISASVALPPEQKAIVLSATSYSLKNPLMAPKNENILVASEDLNTNEGGLNFLLKDPRDGLMFKAGVEKDNKFKNNIYTTDKKYQNKDPSIDLSFYEKNIYSNDSKPDNWLLVKGAADDNYGLKVDAYLSKSDINFKAGSTISKNEITLEAGLSGEYDLAKVEGRGYFGNSNMNAKTSGEVSVGELELEGKGGVSFSKKKGLEAVGSVGGKAMLIEADGALDGEFSIPLPFTDMELHVSGGAEGSAGVGFKGEAEGEIKISKRGFKASADAGLGFGPAAGIGVDFGLEFY